MIMCNSCIYYRRTECWRYPPVWAAQTERAVIKGVWKRPSVRSDDMCGECVPEKREWRDG
jgi:hypothetical protein